MEKNIDNSRSELPPTDSGKLITIYGVNNMGKTTHSERLVKRLNEEGHKAFHVKYPVYDIEPTGSFLNKVLRNKDGQKISEEELQLWFILNRYQYEPKLKELLEQGYIVIAEDYVGTGIAWGVAKGLDLDWCENANKDLVKEDLAILIHGKRDLEAVEEGHVHEQNHELVQHCAEVFSQLADKYNWERVELQDKIEDTASLLYKTVAQFLN